MSTVLTPAAQSQQFTVPTAGSGRPAGLSTLLSFGPIVPTFFRSSLTGSGKRRARTS